MSDDFSWDGTDDALIRQMGEYGKKMHEAVRKIADYFAPILETYAKANRAWQDRTSQARGGLHAFVEEMAGDIVALYLSHGAEHGIFLETVNPEVSVSIPSIEVEFAGRYAIILPTLEEHYQPIMKMLKDVFG